MANNPKLLIADEPTGNLDPDTSWDIAQILYKINNWGTTVLMSTHGSDIVNSMHKRVIRLKSGLLVRDDFKGSYEDIDDYSMKILESQQEKDQQKVSTKDGQNNDSRADSKETPKNEIDSKKEAPKKKKLIQSSKKISFSTKTKKDKVQDISPAEKEKEDEEFEKKVEEATQ
jgi:ABC-type multidrug transport system ATPase subunit